MCYASTVSSVMTFGSRAGVDKQQNRTGTDWRKSCKRREGWWGEGKKPFYSAYNRRVTDRLTTILADVTHPFRPKFDSRRIDTNGRFRVPTHWDDMLLKLFHSTDITSYCKDNFFPSLRPPFLPPFA